MEEKFKKYSECESCPIRNVLDRIGDKWSLMIISILGETDKLRFSEIQKIICDISHKMLAVTLKRLEEDGLIARKMFAVIPPKVEYKLTERGRSLLNHVQSLTTWAAENMADIQTERKSKLYPR
jgi:DNA-binding HxlR family transcriptional regulator